jgi:aminoglycoside phosphotransferase (APT) family kinase protein
MTDRNRAARVEEILHMVLGARAGAAVRLNGGTRSLAFRDRSDVVLRLSDRPDAARRFRNERAALEFAARSNVLCPAAIEWGRSGDWSWQVTTCIVGLPVESVWPTSTEAERRWFVDGAAEAVVALHGIELDFFGHFVGPTFPSAQSALAAQLAAARAEALAAGRFSADEFDRMAARAADLAAVLPPAAPQLRHGDFHFGNLLVAGRSVAVLDFEWAGGGRGVDDLAIGDYQDALCPGSAGPLRAAYRARAGLDPETFRAMLHAARLTWKLIQSATRRDRDRAAVNKEELRALASAPAPFGA